MSKILLVEDDVNLREIYAARLTAEGYKVVVAADGEEALATAVKEQPDLLLLDIMMPKISGFDVLDIIRSTPETKNVKVIMLTALSQEADRERGQKLGANKYLVKSQITLEDVVSAVNEVVAEPSAETSQNPLGLNQYAAGSSSQGGGVEANPAPNTPENANNNPDAIVQEAINNPPVIQSNDLQSQNQSNQSSGPTPPPPPPQDLVNQSNPQPVDQDDQQTS